MSFHRWLYLILAVALALLVLLFVRMHGAAAAGAAKGDTEAGRLSAEAWCTECHSIQRETAGAGKFAPDFTAIAGRRSARWLHAYLRSPHVRMPDFEFQRNAADNLVAYIVSLRRR